jgi:hypothetical protein
LLVACALAGPPPAHPQPSGNEGGVLTFQDDPARTGWNRFERALTPQTVHSLRVLWSASVDGDVDGEPLVVPGLGMFGRVRTVVYVATEQDNIYALDAADGRTLWGPVALGGTVPRSAWPCGDGDPTGITGTPVVDRGAGTLYAVGLTTSDGGHTVAYRIAALDVKSGAMRPGWPVEIAPPTASGLRFDPAAEGQRAALTLSHGAVYVSFGSFPGTCGDDRAWIIGVPVSHPAKQEAYAVRLGGGGISAIPGLAADSTGALYAAIGNGGPQSQAGVGDGVIRLDTSPLRFSGATRDYFVAGAFAVLNAGAVGSGPTAPLVLPDLPGSSTPHLLFAVGAQGVGYLVNRDDMGGPDRGNGSTGEGVYSLCIFGDCKHAQGADLPAAAFWDGASAGRFIFAAGRGHQPAPCRGIGGIVALRLEPAAASRAGTLSAAWCGPPMADPGAPASSGAGPDSGLVWVVDRGPGELYALRARTGAELYASRVPGDAAGMHGSAAPAVWDGRVYVGAGRSVVAYGIP